MAFLAVGASVVAAIFQARSQAHVPVSVVQLIFSTIPIWSAIFSVLLLNEGWLGGLGSVGAVVVLLAGRTAATAGDDIQQPPLQGDE